MKGFGFEIQHKSSRSRARRGTITTPHGIIETPAFITVGTKGTVKALAPEDLDVIGTQCVFANTYHLVLSPGADLVAAHGGIHKMSGINKPMITDSGGFQAFSLAFNEKRYNGLLHDDAEEIRRPTVKITNDGVEFRSHIDGKKHIFTPEASILAQQKIGADFIVAFDECIYNGATRKYTERATERTHEWAKRSLIGPGPLKDRHPIIQQMYGVIQGGLYKDLRQKSAQFIASLPFFGIGLGGVSVGETNAQLREEVAWMTDVLGDDPRPRHLLGVSTYKEILFAIQHGVDTFDCVLPTRDARIGKLYIPRKSARHGEFDTIDILKSTYKQEMAMINKKLLPGVTFAYLHHLFKQRELLAYRLATMNNLWVIEGFLKKVREMIEIGKI